MARADHEAIAVTKVIIGVVKRDSGYQNQHLWNATILSNYESRSRGSPCLLDSRARATAMTPRNIRASWAKPGIFPFNPNRVLDELQRPAVTPCLTDLECNAAANDTVGTLCMAVRTPTTLVGFQNVHCKLEKKLDLLDDENRLYLTKLSNAAEKVYADRAVLFDDNQLLFEQNNEKRTRESVRNTMVGRAKTMSYVDILEAERRRSQREVKTKSNKGKGDPTTQAPQVPVARMLSFADEEVLDARRELVEMGLQGFCHVINFERNARIRC